MSNKYDSYKESGVEWIGEIPSHWDITRIKYKFQIGRGRVISNEDLVEDAIYPVYSSQTLNNGCLGYIETFDFDDKLITWTTDGANAGTVFLREGKFNCTNVCGTLKGKSDDVIPEFDYYFLQYATQFYKRPDTNGAKIMNNEMAVILSLKLSTEEQTAIAKYLDHKTTQIDNLIAKKEQFIQLLEEERVAVINQAVTKGLDPNVPMKDSGIEWLGEIPEHWEVKKLKYCIQIQSGKGITNENLNPDGEFAVWGGNGIMGYTGNFSSDGDDLIIGRVGALCGNVHLVHGKKWISDNALYARTNQNKYFIEFFLKFLDLNRLANKNAQPLITGTMVKEQVICLPNEKEQEKIVNYIINQHERISSILSKTQQEIELLKEFKTALISEVVTGKVDVRNEIINQQVAI